MKTSPTISQILEPFHRHNCHSRQRWLKGMTKPFPCDCDIKEAEAQLIAYIEGVIGGDEPLPTDDRAFDEVVSQNRLRAEQRARLHKEINKEEK